MRLPVELHDAAFSEVHQLGKLQRRAAHLDREAERNVREQAIVSALEAGFALILADRHFVDFTHVPSSLRSSRSEAPRATPHTPSCPLPPYARLLVTVHPRVRSSVSLRLVSTEAPLRLTR